MLSASLNKPFPSFLPSSAQPSGVSVRLMSEPHEKATIFFPLTPKYAPNRQRGTRMRSGRRRSASRGRRYSRGRWCRACTCRGCRYTGLQETATFTKHVLLFYVILCYVMLSWYMLRYIIHVVMPYYLIKLNAKFGTRNKYSFRITSPVKSYFDT